MNEILWSLLTIICVLIAALTVSAGLIWLERRLLAAWQDRYGPNRVGPFGLAQVLSDMIKIFTKEDWIPPFADKPVFVLAPAVIIMTVLMSFAVIPIARGASVANLNIGLLFFLAMSSMGVYSVTLGGWASNSKYSLLGGLRASAQMISYELSLGLAMLVPIMLSAPSPVFASQAADLGDHVLRRNEVDPLAAVAHAEVVDDDAGAAFGEFEGVGAA